MNFFKRMTVLIFAAGMTVASLAYLALASGLVPWYMVETHVKPLIGSLPFIGAGAAWLVWSIMLILLFSSGQRTISHEGEIVIGGGTGGKVNIASSVITEVAGKAAAEVNGIREAFAEITASESGENPAIAMKVGLVISSGTDRNALELGAEAKAKAEEAVKAITGLDKVTADMHIVEVSSGMNREQKNAKRRVV
ncbi:MAG: hypothetical protein Q4D07_03625 [Selenomonadaceae bacterium]|nr:hypothetical protein [Selenomonadaceae bacterium]